MIVLSQRYARSFSFALVLATGGLLATVNGCSASDVAAAEAAVTADAGAGTDAASATTQPSVELTASSDSLTAAGTITLTATVKGGSASAVTFFDGAQQLGQTTTAPYTQSMDLAFPENGAHAFVAKAMIDGIEFTSAAVSVNVNVPSNGLFVDPILGRDDNDGLSLLTPLKTILKALAGLLEGQALYLAPGLYDSATQGSSLDFAVPQIANVLTYPTNGLATLQGLGSGFTFAKGGSIKNIKFDGLTTAVTALAGKLNASGLKFNNVGLPYSLGGDSTSTIDESTVPDFLTNVPATVGSYYLLVAHGNAKTALLGATLNDVRVGVSAILAGGSSNVLLQGLKATNVKSRVMTIADNAKAKLVGSSITGSGLPTGSGAAIAPIYMGLQDTAQPLTQTLEMINSTISGSKGSAIGLDMLPALPSTDTISLIGSHLDNNGAAGLLATAPALVSGAANVVLDVAQSTASGNAGDGLHLERLTGGSITGSNFLSNAGSGIAAGASLLAPTVLALRDSTFGNNAANGLSFLGNPLSSLDLGSAASQGGNVFKGIPSGYAGLNLSALIQVTALGNTWVPNEQGADATGKYTSLLGWLTTGMNVKQLLGSTIKLF